MFFRNPNKISSKAVLILASLWLAACATATGPSMKQQYGGLLEPPAGMGRIYFYRTSVPWMATVKPDVIVNGKNVGTSRFDRYFFRDAQPGRYEVFLTSDPDRPIYFTLASGQVQFVKAVVRWTLIGTKLTAKVVEEAEGRQAVENLKTEGSTPME